MADGRFYHASNIKDLNVLMPISQLHGSDDKVCYLTTVRAYALFYLRDMELDFVTCGMSGDGIVIYDEKFQGQLEALYRGRSGYLYVCENNGQIEMKRKGIWASSSSVTVLNAEYIEDVYDAILEAERNGEAVIIRYESLSDEKKLENAEIMKDVRNRNPRAWGALGLR